MRDAQEIKNISRVRERIGIAGETPVRRRVCQRESAGAALSALLYFICHRCVYERAVKLLLATRSLMTLQATSFSYPVILAFANTISQSSIHLFPSL